MTTLTTPAAPIADEHRVLLWQTAAYADDLTGAARSSHRLTSAYDAMVQFLHFRLLPYLSDEERDLAPSQLRDEHLAPLLTTDHERLRADVDNIESSRTRRLLSLAAGVLVERLDHHMRREEAWLIDPAGTRPGRVPCDATRASHAWVYEQCGPAAWVARITRRTDEAH